MSCETLLVITGPTASGKTELAVEVAETLGGEIINADSVQVYRGFSIGAGAPSEEELKRVPHHLFGVLGPEEEWNAGLFSKNAERIIPEVSGRGRVPLVVGGTGLYISALLGGLVETEIIPEARLRLSELESRLRERGLSEREASASLHQALGEIDSESAGAIKASDPLRIKRALLVAYSSGKSLANLKREHQHQSRRYSAMVCCLLPAREDLYNRINSRIDRMIEGGLVEEVKRLRALAPPESKPLSSIGYKQASLFLNGELNFEEFRESMKQETRRFAKRQATWWRHQPEKFGWVRGEPTILPQAESIASAFRTFSERQQRRGAGEIVSGEIVFFPLSR